MTVADQQVRQAWSLLVAAAKEEYGRWRDPLNSLRVHPHRLMIEVQRPDGGWERLTITPARLRLENPEDLAWELVARAKHAPRQSRPQPRIPASVSNGVGDS